MPTYEYACSSCGEHLEEVQSFSDDPLTTCPSCGGPLRKVFGSVGIVLKGSGFYRTDSRSSSNGSRSAKKDDDKPKGKEKETAAATASGGSDGASTNSSSSADKHTTDKSPSGSSTTSVATN